MTAQILCSDLWFLGMTEADVRMVRRIAGPEYACRLMDDVSPHDLAVALDAPRDGGDPLLIWMGAGAWRFLASEHPDVLRHVSLVPVVLVLEPRADRAMLEMAVDARVQQIARSPLSEAEVHDAIGRARQGRNIYQDMTRMSREIIMNRELLERKSGVCSFLFDFFAASNGASDMLALAADCRRALSGILPVEHVSMVWWGGKAQTIWRADSHGEETDASEQTVLWTDFLLRQAAYLRGSAEASWVPGTAPGRILMLPLGERPAPESSASGCRMGAKGFLALGIGEDAHSGRDCALALNVMCRHLELMLDARPAAFFAACPVLTASPFEAAAAGGTKAGAEARRAARIMEG